MHDGRTQLMRQQLQPQLGGLVLDDEQHFVVMRRLGQRLLRRQQLVQPQISAVGQPALQVGVDTGFQVTQILVDGHGGALKIGPSRVACWRRVGSRRGMGNGGEHSAMTRVGWLLAVPEGFLRNWASDTCAGASQNAPTHDAHTQASASSPLLSPLNHSAGARCVLSHCDAVTVSSTWVCKFMQHRTALPARDVAGSGERFTSQGSGDSRLMHVLQRRAAGFLCALGIAGHTNTQVVISQVYRGGGNSGATLRSDFIELHNIGSTTVSLDGWSVQYASAAGSSWQVTPLTGSVPAGSYYLIKQADGRGGSVALPTPDATGTLAMSGTAGKVALSNSASALSGTCPTGNADLVGYGSTASCAEGKAPTPAPATPWRCCAATTGAPIPTTTQPIAPPTRRPHAMLPARRACAVAAASRSPRWAMSARPKATPAPAASCSR